MHAAVTHDENCVPCEWSTEGHELSGDNPVQVAVLDLVVELVLLAVEGVQIEVTQRRGASEGTDAVEHLEVVGADAERRVAVGNEGRLQPEERGVSFLHRLPQAQYLGVALKGMVNTYHAASSSTTFFFLAITFISGVRRAPCHAGHLA